MSIFALGDNIATHGYKLIIIFSALDGTCIARKKKKTTLFNPHQHRVYAQAVEKGLQSADLCMDLPAGLRHSSAMSI